MNAKLHTIYDQARNNINIVLIQRPNILNLLSIFLIYHQVSLINPQNRFDHPQRKYFLEKYLPTSISPLTSPQHPTPFCDHYYQVYVRVYMTTLLFILGTTAHVAQLNQIDPSVRHAKSSTTSTTVLYT